MPFYCYSSEDGKHTHEIFVHDGASNPDKKPEQIALPNGVVVYRDMALEIGVSSGESGTYPMKCDASGVDDELIPVARDDIKTHKLSGVRVLDDGRMWYQNHIARRKYLKHIGLRDKSGYD